MKIKYLIAPILFCTLPRISHAWGRRGHQIVNETAAQLMVNEVGGEGVSDYSFDIAYYGNVSDVLWKRPASFATERPQHYMDMDVLKPAFLKRPEIKNPYALSRSEFDAKFPELSQEMGRGFWRIRELLGRLEKVTVKLKDKSLPKKPHQALQQEWILNAGVMGHYVGDLGQPLHVVLDYDAEKTNQKGLHRFFEDVCVNYHYPELTRLVLGRAKREWPAFTRKNSSTDVITMLTKLADESTENLVTLLKMDKVAGRTASRACPKYRNMIVSRMVASSLVLAELYRRNLGWTFDEEQFFNFFDGEPPYIAPGEAN